MAVFDVWGPDHWEITSGNASWQESGGEPYLLIPDPIVNFDGYSFDYTQPFDDWVNEPTDLQVIKLTPLQLGGANIGAIDDIILTTYISQSDFSNNNDILAVFFKWDGAPADNNLYGIQPPHYNDAGGPLTSGADYNLRSVDNPCSLLDESVSAGSNLKMYIVNQVSYSAAECEVRELKFDTASIEYNAPTGFWTNRSFTKERDL